MKWISHLAPEVDPDWLKPTYSPRWALGPIQGREFLFWVKNEKETRLRMSSTTRETESKLPRTFRAQEWIFSWSLQKELIMANTLVLAF